VSGQVTGGLRALLGKLVSYTVDFENKEYGTNDHHEEMDLNRADVISSQLKVGEAAKANQYKIVGDGFDLEQIYDLHHIVIDVDMPVHVVESTTPGHHHLYVELPQPVSTERYFKWLEACAEIGLVEPGYVAAFQARGFSCVRLPWVQKPGVAALPVNDNDPWADPPPLFPGV
jgi:hypothetical protein